MTTDEHPTYAPVPGGWLPPGEWQQHPYPEQLRRPRRTGRLVAAIGGGVAALVVAAGGGFAAGWSLHPSSAAQPNSGGYTAPYLPFNPGTGDGAGPGAGSAGTTASGPTDSQIAAVAAAVDPALVDIDTVLGAQNGEAAGTGIVIDSDGLVLTNNHVVAGATSITVTDIGNHRTYRAAVVGYDRRGDVAVLRLSDASGLTTATLAASTTVKAGDPVIAIGNAGGSGGTPSAVGGVVSALNQSITASDESSGSSEQLTGLIEVNAPIEAGDSGGPLLTTSGQVIGVDTAASAGFRYRAAGGDGFAIPTGAATKIVDQIRAGNSSTTVHIGSTAYLGIETTDSGSGGYAGMTGPAVLGVLSGSPAESAGLTRGDVITSVAGHTVDSASSLTNLLDRYHPGDRVKLSWTDVSGQSHSATIKLATGPVG